MTVRQCVDDGDAHAVLPGRRQRLGDRVRSTVDIGEGNQADRQPGLLLQDAHEIGVAHGRQRVVAERAFVERNGADEQMALIDRSGVLGERRTSQRHRCVQVVQQGFGDRSDVSLVGGVECRAVLEEQLARTFRHQRLGAGHRVGDRLGRRVGAGLQRNDDGVGLGERRVQRRHADHLHRAHAAAHQCQSEVRAAGEIVGDAAE